tara:strand:- start:37300 stop:38874 length:1575 start_codon:yes stop_codon:yes gene_type:complete
MPDFYKGLVDYRGQPIRKRELLEEQAAPTSTGVRRPFGEHPVVGLTPGRLAQILREAIEFDPERYLELAEDMEERDPHYASVLATRKSQVARLEVTVEAASDEKEDVEAADDVRELIRRDGFDDELFDILDAIGKGYSATEIIWDTSEGQWVPRELKWRDPRWFVFDQVDGETPLLRDAGEHVPLKPYGWIFHRAKVKSGLTIRGGLARAVAWTFLFKHFTIKDWAIFCEAYGQPLRLGKYDASATEADKRTLMRAVANIGTDYAAIVPQSMAVEFIEASLSGSHELYEKRADWLDRQVSKIVLGQTGTTDSQAGSGYAQAKVHDTVKDDIEERDAKQLAASLNRDLIKPFVDLNRGPRRNYPKLRIGRPDDVDLDKLMSRTKTFVSLGGKVGMSTVRDKLGYPDPEDDEELLSMPTRPAPPVAHDDRRPTPLKPVAANRQDDDEGDAVSRGARAILDEDAWEPAIAPIVKGLEEEIAQATSEAQVREILQRRAVELDVGTLTRILARATFAARISGEAEEELD